MPWAQSNAPVLEVDTVVPAFKALRAPAQAQAHVLSLLNVSGV